MFQTKQTTSGVEISYPGRETLCLTGWTIADANQAIASAIEDTPTVDEAYECLSWLSWASK